MWWKDAQHHVLREMQTKTARDHCTPIRMTQIQNSDTKCVGNFCPHRDSCTGTYSSAAYDSQHSEAARMSLCRRMDKRWHIQAMEYYSARKRNELSSHEKTWKKLNANYYVKEVWRGYTLYDSNGKMMETVETSVVARSSERARWIDGAQRMVRAAKLLCMILYWWRCDYTLIQAHRMYHAEMNPDVN